MKESLQGKDIGERSTIVSAEWAKTDKIKWRERLKNVCMNMSMLYTYIADYFIFSRQDMASNVGTPKA
jgi:hypothetical protein